MTKIEKILIRELIGKITKTEKGFLKVESKLIKNVLIYNYNFNGIFKGLVYDFFNKRGYDIEEAQKISKLVARYAKLVAKEMK